ncbi:MAG: hypothetical protein ABJB12_05910 [Pseudomonadota bacterium]
MERLDLTALGAFLFDHIESYERLTALFLLYRLAEPQPVAFVASELKMDVSDARRVLQRLSASKLIALDEDGPGAQCRYAPATPELAGQVQILVAAYEDNQVRVVEIMTANAIERLRTKALRVFADGFRWRGGNRDG